MENFNFFAIMYLNDWVWWDDDFIEKIASGSKIKQLSGLLGASKYYKITRNFKIIKEKNRFDGVRKELSAVRGGITKNNIDEKVLNLSESLKSIYGKNVVSAASKFLWLKYQSPVIIYDKRALNWLKANGYKIAVGDYVSYRVAWLKEYNKKRGDIRIACSELSRVKKYSHAYEYTKLEVSKITSKEWFRERVFDKYLWFNAYG